MSFIGRLGNRDFFVPDADVEWSRDSGIVLLRSARPEDGDEDHFCLANYARQREQERRAEASKPKPLQSPLVAPQEDNASSGEPSKGEEKKRPRGRSRSPEREAS